MYVSKVEKHDKCLFDKWLTYLGHGAGYVGRVRGVGSSWVKGGGQLVSWFECRAGCSKEANELVCSIPICHQLMG